MVLCFECAVCEQKRVVDEESDEDMADAQANFAEEEEDEIIESDIELEGETVEPDNDPPQKVNMID